MVSYPAGVCHRCSEMGQGEGGISTPACQSHKGVPTQYRPEFYCTAMEG